MDGKSTGRGDGARGESIGGEDGGVASRLEEGIEHEAFLLEDGME